MRKFLPSALCFLLLLCVGSSLQAQFGAWTYLQPITAVNQTGAAQTDYQIRLVVNTQALITQGKLESDGRDLRFGDACGTSVYDYWIEDYLNTDTTVIWVRLDSIANGATANFSMFYGNSSATAASSFAQTFPNAIVTSGNQTLAGPGNYGWIQVNTGDTLFLATGVLNDLEARVVDVQGVIWGAGRGHQAPGTSNTGTGPGGGNWGTSSGAGGGSYGGLGGVGGYDSNDPIIQPGAIYGTTTGPDIAMGSSGGSASTVTGGNGGGGLRLASEWLSVSGTINCNGGLAQQPGGGQGAGGGSGGGILLHGEHLDFSGSLSAQGNGGSIGTSTANDDGGGGGGGRIKLFYETSIANTGTTSLNGGPGGVNGGSGQGEPGNIGTFNVGTLTFNIVTASAGAEIQNSAPAPPVINAPTTVCDGDSVIISVSGSFSTYTFQVDTATVQSGASGTYGYLPTMSNTVIVTSAGACTYVDTLPITVAPIPSPGLSTSGNVPACDGDSVVLSVSPGFTSVLWNTGATTDSIFVTSTFNYMVTVTDSNGCSNTDNISLNFLPAPMPTLVTNPAGPGFCEGDTVVVSTQNPWLAYNWSTGDTTPTITLTQSNTIGLMVTDSNGCTGGPFTTIGFNPLPTPTISVNGSTLSTTQSYTSYQWLFNGMPISGANAMSYQAGGTGVYSVEVTDANGCVGTSDTTFVFVSFDQAIGLPNVGVHPNPFSDQVEVQAFLSASGEMDLEVVDVTGRTWHHERTETDAGAWTHQLNLGSLPAGVYFLRLQSESGQAVLRIVRQ